MGKEWEVKVSRRERRIGIGKGEGTKGESWNSKGMKVKVLERKGIGNGMELTWENRERLEWNGKRRRTRERGSVPWSKLNAPRILKDGSRISCGKEGNGRSMWEVGNRELGKRDKRERRERKLEFTWNGKGSYVWKGRRSEGVKGEKEGMELGMEREGKRKELELEVECLGSRKGRNESAGIGKETESVALEWNRERKAWEWGSWEWLGSGNSMVVAIRSHMPKRQRRRSKRKLPES